MRWFLVVLAACGGNGDSRHIGDGQGSAGPAGYVEFALDSEGGIYSVAAFYTSASIAPTDSCTRMIQGTCSAVICPAAPTATTPANNDAGTIAITGGSPSRTVTLMTGAGNAYSYNGDDGSEGQYPTGTVLTMTGTGATVPAFSGTIAMPSAPTITSPAVSATVPRSADMTVAWTGDTAGATVAFELYQMPYSFVECAFLSGSSGAVPSSMMQLMAAGPATAIANVFAINTQTVGDYTISYEASQPAVAPAATGSFVSPVTLQ